MSLEALRVGGTGSRVVPSVGARAMCILTHGTISLAPGEYFCALNHSGTMTKRCPVLGQPQMPVTL